MPRHNIINPNDYNSLLKQRDVEKILEVSPSTMEVWRMKGLGPKWVRLGRAVRYRAKDVQDYIDGLTSFQSTADKLENE